MKTTELIGRILLFGVLAIGEIALATVKHFIEKIRAVIKSAL